MTAFSAMLRLLLDQFGIALSALWSNKIRSVLTMLGIIIGVFSIITLIGIGQGVKRDVTKEVTELGSNLIVVLPGQLQTEGGGFNPSASLGASTLTEDDLQALLVLPEIESGTPLSLLAGLPSADSRSAPSTLTLAVEPSYFELFSTADLVAGRLFNDDDLSQKRRVAVLDVSPRKKLFPDVSASNVIGKSLTFAGESFEIIGALETPQSSTVFGGPNFADALFLPYTTAKEVIANTQIFRIVLQAREDADIEAIVDRVRATVKELHKGTEDFSVLTQDDLLDIINSIVTLLTSAVAGIGAISLVVGGIGIMNIMLVSVTERTKEIGLRKAIGAPKSAILSQFLIEAVVLSLLGGAIGVLLALAVGFPIKAQAGITVLVNGPSIGLAFAFSLLVGVLFGVAPAIRAARLNPIDALRYE